MNHAPPKGTYDATPDPRPEEFAWRDSKKWDFVESIAREIAALFGCSRVSTPIFENAELYLRSVGESSDIVSKEMYTFEDRAQRLMALRPEGTASAVRAFIDKRLYETPFKRLFYIGPMFRYERPQSGRYRQHQQLGIELFGSSAPEVDVEAIHLMLEFYKRCGLKDLTLNLNSLGSRDCQKNYTETLRTFLKQHEDSLGEDSKRRLETNPLRILDTKDPEEKKLLASAPKLIDSLSPQAKQHFECVLSLLETLSIPYTLCPNLVRGLDYYTHTVFEVTSDSLGAQNSIGGGGRYDHLVKELGGPETPAVGFATGLERVIQTMIAQKAPFEEKQPLVLSLFAIGEKAKKSAFETAARLREAGISVFLDLLSKKPAAAVQNALKLGSLYFLVLGENELTEEKFVLKHLASREEKVIPSNQLTDFLNKYTINPCNRPQF